jgi:hypothetical protein
MHLDYCLIDATAPFFLALDGDGEVNWSKVPFERLENGDGLNEEKCGRITNAFAKYIEKVKSIGYDSISLDDVAHLVDHTLYREGLRKKIGAYIGWYERLMAIARLKNMNVFITTDILFFNDEIEAYVGMDARKNSRFFCQTLSMLFQRFPDIAGVIVRLGESDGIDVQGDFRSRIVIRTARQCRRYLRDALAVCEQFEKQLIVRTWTLGAFPIGDLMWNPVTFRAAFKNLSTDNLIVSQKFGETDFFRYLTMSPLLFEGNYRRIVEFQARREYEGFGEFPSFVGFDYERYARYLCTCPTLIGISVWCQTGGWSHFRRITYGENSSPWVELNVFATVKIFRESKTAEDAAAEFIADKSPGTDPRQFIRFLRLSDKAIKELWYIPEFALQRIYFRRTRVPPLLYLFWDTVIINHAMRKIIRRFVHERREAIHDGYRALEKIETMKELAISMQIDTKDIDFQYDTFRILAAVREYYFGEWNADTVRHLRLSIENYRKKHPQGFHIACDLNPVRFKKQLIKSIFRISLRRQPGYRSIDRLFLLRFAWLVYPLFRIWEKKRLPSFTRSQAMGVEVLFK